MPGSLHQFMGMWICHVLTGNEVGLVLAGKKSEGSMRSQMMTDGHMTFDQVITDWEVISTGVKLSWDMYETFSFFFVFFFLPNLGSSFRLSKCLGVQRKALWFEDIYLSLMFPVTFKL